jgi:hypothetical protein
MNKGLVVRDPELRLLNESFRKFVRQQVRKIDLLEWEEEGGPSAWNLVKWLLPVPLVLLAGFLFMTQRDAVTNVVGIVIALGSLAPVIVNLYSQFQQLNLRRQAEEERKERREERKQRESDKSAAAAAS